MPARMTGSGVDGRVQHACCGGDFALGDQVSWTLGPADVAFLGPLLGPHLPTWSITIPALHTVTGDDGVEVVVAGRGDLVVHLPGAGASARLTVGLLAAESHGRVGRGTPPTRGWIREIKIVNWSHSENAPGSRWHEPVPGSAELTTVRRSEAGGSGHQGFLVELDVAD